MRFTLKPSPFVCSPEDVKVKIVLSFICFTFHYRFVRPFCRKGKQMPCTLNCSCPLLICCLLQSRLRVLIYYCISSRLRFKGQTGTEKLSRVLSKKKGAFSRLINYLLFCLQIQSMLPFLNGKLNPEQRKNWHAFCYFERPM